MPPRDICKGCRECYSGVLKAIVQNPIVAGLCMGIPTYYLLLGLLFHNSIVSFVPEGLYISTTISTPYYTIIGLTIFAWLLELIAMKRMLPSLLSICAFGHAAFGSWWLVNLVILFFAGWYYIPFRIMILLLSSIVTPVVIWHITGDILRAYTQKMIDDIANHHRSLASQDAAFSQDPEIGNPK